MKKYFNLLLLFFLISLISACGFHLKGQMPLAPPLHKMYLDIPDPYGALARNLKENLKVSHVQLVEEREKANTILVVSRDDNSQELLSVNGTQQTRQYNLKVTVTFSVTDNKGMTLIPPVTLIEARAITVQSNQILGSSNEANLYYQQMRRTLALAIMDRLSSREATRLVNESYSMRNNKQP